MAQAPFVVDRFGLCSIQSLILAVVEALSRRSRHLLRRKEAPAAGGGFGGARVAVEEAKKEEGGGGGKAEKTKRRFEPKLGPKLVETHKEINDGEGEEEDAQRPVLGDTLKLLTPDPVEVEDTC